MNIPFAKIAKWGLVSFFGGTRKQQPGLAALGAALAAIGWYREHSGPQKTLLYRQTLKPGEDVKVVLKRLGDE